MEPLRSLVRAPEERRPRQRSQRSTNARTEETAWPCGLTFERRAQRQFSGHANLRAAVACLCHAAPTASPQPAPGSGAPLAVPADDTKAHQAEAVESHESEATDLEVDRFSEEPEPEESVEPTRSAKPFSRREIQQVKKQMIRASTDAYDGNCPCAYDTDVRGRSCGRRSAYSRPGGESPLCYSKDITDEMVREFLRARESTRRSSRTSFGRPGHEPGRPGHRDRRPGHEPRRPGHDLAVPDTTRGTGLVNEGQCSVRVASVALPP
jgi:hypothetical protein